MSNATFPVLTNSSWILTRKPNFSTQVQTAVSGLRTRVAYQSYPIWEWTIKNGILQSATAIADLQAIQGFFNARYGMFDSWLWSDPEDNAVTDQVIGTGDGATLAFQLQRTWGGFTEPILALNGAPAVKVGGAVTGVTTSSTGVITFAAAPAVGATITATFAFYWRVAFTMDVADYERFCYQLWKCGELSFIQVTA